MQRNAILYDFSLDGQAPRGVGGGAADGRERRHRRVRLVPPLHGQAAKGDYLLLVFYSE